MFDYKELPDPEWDTRSSNEQKDGKAESEDNRGDGREPYNGDRPNRGAFNIFQHLLRDLTRKSTTRIFFWNAAWRCFNTTWTLDIQHRKCSVWMLKNHISETNVQPVGICAGQLLGHKPGDGWCKFRCRGSCVAWRQNARNR